MNPPTPSAFPPTFVPPLRPSPLREFFPQPHQIPRPRPCRHLLPHEWNFRFHSDHHELPDARLKLLDGHLRRDFDLDMEVDMEILDVNDDETVFPSVRRFNPFGTNWAIRFSPPHRTVRGMTVIACLPA
jgi:hypothetical protein